LGIVSSALRFLTEHAKETMEDTKVPISIGEALDKLTILEIKEVKLTDKDAVALVKSEAAKIVAALNEAGVPQEVQSGEDARRLYYINLALWNLEDEFRESSETIGDHLQAVRAFTDLATSVPTLNRKRSDAKREINEKHGSSIMEVKQYHGEEPK